MCHADADLVAAGVGRLVAEDDQVGRLGLGLDHLDERGRRRLRVPVGAVGLEQDRAVGAERHRVAQLLLGLGRAERHHRRRAAVGLDDPHRLLDAALLVRADREAEVAGLDRALVLGEDDLAAGQRHALDADEDVHHDRMRLFSGSKIGVDPATATVTGNRSAMYSTASSAALDRVLGRQVGHQDVLADRRRRAGRGHERAAALAVDQRRAVAGHDRLAAEHEARHAGRGRVVVDRERAHDRRRLLLAVAHVRLLADEVLVLDLPPRHVGLDDVVLGVELEAERAVALLDPPGRAVDADPGGHDAVRLAGLPDRVPQPRALLDRHVQLPPEVADVGDAGSRAPAAGRSRSCGSGRTGSPRATRRRWSGSTRMSRARGPQSPSVVHADVRSVTCALPSSGAWSATHLRSAMPCRPPVTKRKCSSREPQDREVGAEAAARRQQRRVDDAPDRHVHLAHRDLLHGRERARAGDVEDAERAQVEDRRAVAHRQVLGVDDRRPPARVPLRRAGR